MATWAVVIGVDQYWSEGAHLRGAVRDALSVREWLVDPTGANVPPENVQLVLGRAEHSPEVGEHLAPIVATKANIILAVSNLMDLSGGKGERLYFFFAGHGLTTRVSNRDESALLATDFTSVNTDHSIALRSLWEFFETTQFEDQFLFVDACRNVPPWGEDAFTLGSWTLPRSRNPGLPPVQQFILYATSPKLKAVEVREKAGEEHGAFTAALLAGLRGAGAAKAWSWERNCYEVRWERLADYVKTRIQDEARKVADTPEGSLLQIPQDTGSRGVAGRPRDVAVTSFPAEAFPQERLEVLLDPDTAYATADVRVLDALGDVVAGQVGGTGSSVVFYLPPRTYALRAAEPKLGQGRVPMPVELYAPLTEAPKIALRPIEDPPAAASAAARPAGPAPAQPPAVTEAPASTRGVEAAVAPGWIPLEAPDPLSLVEVADETGRVLEVVRAGDALELPAGFYRVRHVGPETTIAYEPIALASGETEGRLRLAGTKPSPATAALAKVMGARVGKTNAVELKGREPVSWAQTSTLVAMALGSALQGETGRAALELGARARFGRSKQPSGLAVYVVSEVGELDPSGIELRIWPAGEAIPNTTEGLRLVNPRLGELVVPCEPGRYWVSLLREGEGRAMVFARVVLRDRIATLVVQITKGIRLFQYLPLLRDGDSTTLEVMRRVEYLERMLLAGRLDGAYELVRELEDVVEDDPFVGCLCGYVLLRLGRLDELREVADAVIRTAPQLSDGFILQGECAAAAGAAAAKQSYTEAVVAGVPLFAEGLTRLLEGARANDILHPRTAIVRYLFQHHMRGSMWTVCTPPKLQPGRLLVTAASLGYEA